MSKFSDFESTRKSEIAWDFWAANPQPTSFKTFYSILELSSPLTLKVSSEKIRIYSFLKLPIFFIPKFV